MVLTLFMLIQSTPDDSKAMEIIPEKKDIEKSTCPFVCYQQLLHIPSECVRWFEKKKKKKEHLVSGTAWEEIKWNYTESIQVSITANEQDEESVRFILSSNEGLVYLLKVSKPVKEGSRETC